MQPTEMPYPPIRKTPLMRLIEAMDPGGRDVREFVRDSYERTQSTEGVAQEIAALTGEKASGAVVYAWITGDFGWTIGRVLVVPDALSQDAPTSEPVAA